MHKTLVMTAAAMALVAGAAGAQQAYDSTVTRTTTQTVPVDQSSTTTRVQKSVDPYTGTTTERTDTYRSASPTPVVPMSGSSSPPAVTSYHEERTIAPAPATTEKTWSTQSVAPAQQTTTWSQTTTTDKQ